VVVNLGSGHPNYWKPGRPYLDQVIEIDAATLAAALTRMLYHTLDDVVGTSSVLGDLFQSGT
jgi:hypothetical protein